MVPFWKAHFCKDENTILPPQLRRSPATLSHTIRVIDATNFFAAYIRYVHRRLYNFKPNDSIVPYQRALLRFQLFCEIFHQWVNSIGCAVSFPKNSYAWFKFNDKLEQDEGQTERTAIIETLKCRVSESRPSRSSWQCRFIEDERLRRSDRSRTDAD